MRGHANASSPVINLFINATDTVALTAAVHVCVRVSVHAQLF